jgi:SAM-dependent methyltransferase
MKIVASDPCQEALHYSLYTRIVADHLMAIMGGQGEGGSLLDVGCGVGYFLRRIHAAWPGRYQLHGIEYDPLAVEQARNSVPGVFGVGSVTDIAYPDQSFDVVLNLSVLEHVPDDGKAMDELVRVLRPGGRLIVSVPCLDGLRSRSRLRNLGHEQPGTPEHHVRLGYTVENLLAAFAQRGARPRRVILGMYLLSELLMDLVKLAYFKTGGGLDSQSRVGQAGGSPAFRVYRKIFPLLYLVELVERRLFPLRDRGHICTVEFSK